MTAPAPALSLRAMVVDDEPLARARLRALLEACQGDIRVVAEAPNAPSALALLHAQDIDVLFLDIHMPGSSGLTLAQTLRDMPRPPAVVFVTAHTDHAVAAFDVEAVDYLTKPVRLQRLQAAVWKVERFLRGERHELAEVAHQEVLVIQERQRTERVPLSQVLYFKAELKYVTVRTVSRSYILDGALNELEERYSAQFIRIHRNALVARTRIRA
nr:LytTR family DNA-binding domain-containing protein [Rhodoferax sp.]